MSQPITVPEELHHPKASLLGLKPMADAALALGTHTDTECNQYPLQTRHRKTNLRLTKTIS